MNNQLACSSYSAGPSNLGKTADTMDPFSKDCGHSFSSRKITLTDKVDDPIELIESVRLPDQV